MTYDFTGVAYEFRGGLRLSMFHGGLRRLTMAAWGLGVQVHILVKPTRMHFVICTGYHTVKTAPETTALEYCQEFIYLSMLLFYKDGTGDGNTIVPSMRLRLFTTIE